MAWTDVKNKKRKGTLSEHLLDLAVETGAHHILVMAKQAKQKQLGEAGVAKAKRLLRNASFADQRRGGDAPGAARRAEAAEKRAKELEQRLAKLEALQKVGSDDSMAAVEESGEPSRTERRPAPEVAVAEAEARAAELEASASRLRAVGLAGQAEALEKQAVEQRKIAEKAPDPGKRVDMQKAWIKRAEARLEKAAARIGDAQKELREAQEAHQALQRELDDGRMRLSQLRNELYRDEAADIAETQPPAAASASNATPAVAELHVQLSAVRAERDALASAAAAERRAVAELAPLGAPELQSRLEKCAQDYSRALGEARWDAADVLAETMRKLTASLRKAHEAAAQEPSAFNPNS